MKRFYLSKIFQDTAGQYGIPGAWRHGIQKHANREYIGGEIEVDPVTGIPTQKAILVLVGGKSHAALVNDPDIIPLPDVSPDIKVSSVHTPTKLKIKNAIKALGFAQAEVDAVWDNADGMRDVLNHYGRKNNLTFDANDFDLTDV